METNKPTLEQALAEPDFVAVTKIVDITNSSGPPNFAVITLPKGHSGSPLIYAGFPSRSAAWDAIEDISLVKRPIPKPDQDLIDSTDLFSSLVNRPGETNVDSSK